MRKSLQKEDTLNTLGLNKQKIVNDPVHGFISIRTPLAYELISHPFFQRLRNIKQLGLTNLVYPGACHNRFQHALGAMYLMGQAVESLRAKGHEITEEELEAAECAMLLHDIGHGPFSHALEFSIVAQVSHEDISAAMMQQLNAELGGKLDLSIRIFGNTYSKKFLHQLVSSQLDVDRMDYLRRDSFFSGVAEGAIGVERIIKMLDVLHDEVVVEAKGIHSVEKFLIARRLMYWQVYLHKTVVAAEQLLVNIFRRAKELAHGKQSLFATEALSFFLHNELNLEELSQEVNLYSFATLTDSDIDCAVKSWSNHPDKVLSMLCRMLRDRKLPKVEISNEPFDKDRIEQMKKGVVQELGIGVEDAGYFITSDTLVNKAYSLTGDVIKVLHNNEKVEDIYEASDMLGATAFSHDTTKYFLSYPKNNRGIVK